MTGARILIVEDSASLAMSYAAQLTDAGHEVELAQTGAEAEAQLGAAQFDVVLLDLQLPDANGLDLFQAQASRLQETSVIVVTADGSLGRAVEAMRLGAYDFLVKPVSSERLLTTVRNGAERHQLAREVKAVRSASRRDSFHGFIGASPVMQAIYRAIENIGDSKAAVFITGESGSGKEVAAEAIHLSGRRAKKPFIAINCGAIPENLLESELFGHVKGAFTGALENRIGAAKAADGGTLFLDEICEMELKLQVKLLRFLQTGMIQRVGNSKAEPVDVRIVCATNRQPQVEVAEGRFREDLYYRLNVIPLELPPLRERGDDVLVIARKFAERFADEEGRLIEQITPESEESLLAHSWPGNVRELQNTIRRAIVMGDGPELIVEPMPRMASSAASLAMTPEPGASADGQERAPASSPGPSFDAGQAREMGADLSVSLDAIERVAIEARLGALDGNVVQTARTLGVSPSTIYRKMEKWEQAG